MPLFFIDTSDEDFFCKDTKGFELRDVEAAKLMAIDALPDMARQKLPDGDKRSFLAIVRDHEGRTLLQATLTLNVVSLVPNCER